MARTLIRNIIGELELRGAPSSHIQLVLKEYDEVMNSPEETPQEAREAQGGKEAG